jgi:hypothetical protein
MPAVIIHTQYMKYMWGAHHPIFLTMDGTFASMQDIFTGEDVTYPTY